MDQHDMHVAKMVAMEADKRWYGWGTPIGLMIFFNGMALFAILIKFLFLMK